MKKETLGWVLGTPPEGTSNTRWPPSCTTQNSAPVPLHPAKVTSAHLLTRPSDQTGEVVFLRSQIMTMLSRHTDTSCLLVGSMLREAGVTPSAVMGRQTSVSALLCLVSRLTRADGVNLRDVHNTAHVLQRLAATLANLSVPTDHNLGW